MEMVVQVSSYDHCRCWFTGLIRNRSRRSPGQCHPGMSRRSDQTCWYSPFLPYLRPNTKSKINITLLIIFVKLMQLMQLMQLTC